MKKMKIPAVLFFLLIIALSSTKVDGYSDFGSSGSKDNYYDNPGDSLSDYERELVNKARLKNIPEYEIKNYINTKRSMESESDTNIKKTGQTVMNESSAYKDTGSESEDSLFKDENMFLQVKEPQQKRSKGLKYLRERFDTLPFFGYDVFRSVPDAFKPAGTGPVDAGYMVSAGDVLRLSVWGQTEFQYELEVSRDGKIFIPVVGQVLVTGMPFGDLQKKVKNLLSRHYSGLSKRRQTVFMDLSVVQTSPLHIYVMGEVKRPGGYVINSYSTVFNVLYKTGGPLKTGSLRNIKVYRNNELAGTVDLYGYLIRGNTEGDVRLQTNDVIFVPPCKVRASVEGEVLRPGIYEMKKGETLKDIVEFAGGFLPTSHIDHIHINRILPVEKRVKGRDISEYFNVSREDYNSDKKRFAIYDFDKVTVPKVYQRLRDYVNLCGTVKNPGKYEINDTLTLKGLVFEIGEIKKDSTYMGRGDLVRIEPDGISTRTIPFSLEKLREDEEYNRDVRAGDSVVIYGIGVEKLRYNYIVVSGEVRNPGLYRYSEGMDIKDAILRSGGFTQKAFKPEVEVSRMRIDTSVGDTLARVFEISLPESLSFKEGSDEQKGTGFLLQSKDRILIRPNPGYIEPQSVTLGGRVKFAGDYVITRRDEKLADVIDRAGGFLPDAFPKGATLFRGGKRIVVDFDEAYYNRRRGDNVVLKEGDSITVPRKPNTVEVSGEVNNPGLFTFQGRKRVKNYIERAGGFTDSSKTVLITKPGGETKKVNRVFFFGNPKVPEGSSINVTKKKPKKERKEGPSVGEVIKDIFAIMSSALTILILAQRLE